MSKWKYCAFSYLMMLEIQFGTNSYVASQHFNQHYCSVSLYILYKIRFIPSILLLFLHCVQRKLDITGTAIGMQLWCFSPLLHLFKSQWLTSSRIGLLNINFNVGFSNCWNKVSVISHCASRILSENSANYDVIQCLIMF